MRQSILHSSSLAILLSPLLATAFTFPSLHSIRDALDSRLLRRDNATVTPAAINVSPSQYWDGDDGKWSTFTLLVGNHTQNVRVILSTAANTVLTIEPDGCPDGYLDDCANKRGGLFNPNQSLTYVPHSIYDIGVQKSLGLDTNAHAGFDTVTMDWQGSGGPGDSHTVVFGVPTPQYWLGFFGLNPRPVNFSNFEDPTPSFVQALVTANSIPSLSYAYTAGNQYRLDKVFGSLVLGGYDTSRFEPTNITFPFNADISLDLSVQLKDITTNASSDSLLPDGQISVFLDSTSSQLYLPESACAAFERAFNLTYDNSSNFYLVDSDLHTTLTAQNPAVTFTIGPQVDNSDEVVNITLPYGAFDLEVTFPNVMDPNSSYYFPLQRAVNSTQYIFGRTFFQEAYLIADYDRGNFTVAPCTWNQTAIQNAEIVSILRANETRTGISTGAVVGIVVGVVLGIIALLIGVLFWLRHKKQEKRRVAELEAKSVHGEGKTGESEDGKPFISRPLGGELGGDGEIHELNTPYKPVAQELDSPYNMDPNRAGYTEMEGGEHYAPGKYPLGGAAEMHGSTPVFEMPGSDVHEMDTPEHTMRTDYRKFSF